MRVLRRPGFAAMSDVCDACLVRSARRQCLDLRDVCHFEVLFHLGANQDPKPGVL